MAFVLKPHETRKPTRRELDLFHYFDEFRKLYKKCDLFSSYRVMIEVFHMEDPEYLEVFNVWVANQNDHGVYLEVHILK